MIYRTSGNVDSILSYEFFSELFRIIFEKAKKFITLDGINISGCSIYLLIAKFMLFDLKTISKFYVYCASRSDFWRPNNTYRLQKSTEQSFL